MSAHLVVVDMQHVFGDPDSPWFAPRFGEILDTVDALVAAHTPKVTFTRFVAPTAPTGAWRAYYERFPFALQTPDAPLYQFVERFTGHAGTTLDATTFGKWGRQLAERLAGDDMVLAGVSTDCCVLSTAVAAADAGVHVRVVADACAGATDTSHEQALAVLRCYAPLIDVVDSTTLLT